MAYIYEQPKTYVPRQLPPELVDRVIAQKVMADLGRAAEKPVPTFDALVKKNLGRLSEIAAVAGYAASVRRLAGAMVEAAPSAEVSSERMRLSRAVPDVRDAVALARLLASGKELPDLNACVVDGKLDAATATHRGFLPQRIGEGGNGLTLAQLQTAIIRQVNAPVVAFGANGAESYLLPTGDFSLTTVHVAPSGQADITFDIYRPLELPGRIG